MNHLKETNDDEIYDHLIDKVENYMGDSDKKEMKIPSGTKLTIQRAVYGKLVEALNKLRQNRKDKIEEENRKLL